MKRWISAGQVAQNHGLGGSGSSSRSLVPLNFIANLTSRELSNRDLRLSSHASRLSTGCFPPLGVGGEAFAMLNSWDGKPRPSRQDRKSDADFGCRAHFVKGSRHFVAEYCSRTYLDARSPVALSLSGSAAISRMTLAVSWGSLWGTIVKYPSRPIICASSQPGVDMTASPPASQSSNRGCVGGSARVPKSSGVRTRPRPK